MPSRNKNALARTIGLAYSEAAVRKLRAVVSLQTRSGKSVSALLVLALFLVVQALSASDAFHRLVHSDANQPDHQCAATLLSQGQISLAPGEVSVLRPTFFLGEVHSPSVPLLVAVEYRLLPGRAPPSHLT